MATNRSAFLDAAGTPLRVADSEIPKPGANDIIVRNRYVGVNDIDPAQAAGFNVQKYPTVLGMDLAGDVYEVGSNVTRFKKGDRVIGHAQQFITGQAEDGAFSLYSRVPTNNAAILPANIDYKDGVVLPLALNTAICGLFKEGMMGLDWPSVDTKPNSNGKVVVVYGGSSSVGLTAIQLAINAGCRVIATASSKNFDLVRKAGASHVFDYKSSTIADDIANVVGKDQFAGLYNAIGIPPSFEVVTPIMEKLGGGFLANTKPPGQLPGSINAKFVLGVGDFGQPAWEHFVTKALESRRLQCLPQPRIEGKGLESLQEVFAVRDRGVSGQKTIVEL
jgi:NADPH:quinone reductase-like Zn-dependent oxidoreductase